jgi:hypothetical protein
VAPLCPKTTERLFRLLKRQPRRIKPLLTRITAAVAQPTVTTMAKTLILIKVITVITLTRVKIMLVMTITSQAMKNRM